MLVSYAVVRGPILTRCPAPMSPRGTKGAVDSSLSDTAAVSDRAPRPRRSAVGAVIGATAVGLTLAGAGLASSVGLSPLIAATMVGGGLGAAIGTVSIFKKLQQDPVAMTLAILVPPVLVVVGAIGAVTGGTVGTALGAMVGSVGASNPLAAASVVATGAVAGYLFSGSESKM